MIEQFETTEPSIKKRFKKYLMTKQERDVKFKQLFDSINRDLKMSKRIEFVAKLLSMSSSTIRVYLMQSPPNPMSERSLKLFEQKLAAQEKRKKIIDEIESKKQ
jgi:hypothetical protein